MTRDYWPKYKVIKLQYLLQKGFSFKEIGECIGVSRNAAAGMAHRLGLRSMNRQPYYLNKKPRAPVFKNKIHEKEDNKLSAFFQKHHITF